jgi:hypothetical protein
MAEVAPNGIGEFVKGLDRSMPDAEYGQRVKARAEAAALLDAGYAQLAKIAAPSSGVQSQENDAR